MGIYLWPFNKLCGHSGFGHRGVSEYTAHIWRLSLHPDSWRNSLSQLPGQPWLASEITGERHKSQNAVIGIRASGEMNFLETAVAVALGLEATLILPQPGISGSGEPVLCVRGLWPGRLQRGPAE